jgi:dipeptidyl-peptidase-4
MKRISFIALLFVLPLTSPAQKRTFTFEQIFKGQFPSIFNPLPEIGGWVDDEHYIEIQTGVDGKESALSR